MNPRNKRASKFFPSRLKPFLEVVSSAGLPSLPNADPQGQRNRRGKDTIKREQHTFGIWKADASLQESSHFFFKGPGSK